MSDERHHDEPIPEGEGRDEAVPTSSPTTDGDGAQDPAASAPEAGSASGGDDPLIPRRLPTAASFFGEPRPPRHSAHVDSPASAPSGLPSEEPASEPAAPEPDPAPVVDAPAVPFYVPPPSPEPASPAAPHPQALDLSALQGGDDLLPAPSDAPPSDEPAPAPWHLGEDTASIDARALPRHDEPGETPTAAFGALFGGVPTAGTPVVPAQNATPEPEAAEPAPLTESEPASSNDEPSFTELISMPPAELTPASAPATFDWSDLPAPRTTEIDLAHAAPSAVQDPEPAESVPTASEAPAPAEPVAAAEPVAPASASVPEPIVPEPIVPEPIAPAWDDDPATQALPRVWSLDDEPVSAPPTPASSTPASSTPASSTPVWSLSDDEPSPAAPVAAPEPFVAPTAPAEPASDPAPPTDPFKALFGDALEPTEEPAPTRSEAADDSPQAPEAGVDGGWADEPRAPIPPALDEIDVAPASAATPDRSVASEPTAEQKPDEDSQPATEAWVWPVEATEPEPEPEPVREPEPEWSAADTPTVAYVPPTEVVPAADAGSADEDPATPSRFSQQPGSYRGPSSRPVMPIDASKAPATWVAAAAQAQSQPSAVSTEAAFAPTVSSAAAVPPVSRGGGGGGFAEWPQNRRILVFVGIGVGFVLILVALFFIGQAVLGHASSPAAAAPTTSAATAPIASRTATPTTTPKPAATAATPPAAAGPAATGTHAWSDLQGGECLGSFTNAWQSTYQVVGCSSTHPAQMVAKGTVAGTTYPGFSAIGAQVGPLCQSNTVIDFSKAQAYTDIQVSASYPATQAQWDAGDHSYYCFVSRSSGQAITGSVKAGS